MAKIINPHDKFFRRSMMDKRIAKQFFDFHLPKKILALVDLNTLQLCNGSYIEERYRESFTDILYSVFFQGQLAYFYLLVEHQSIPDKLMPFRILYYICRIIQQHLDQTQSNILPIIYPLVFYHGETNYCHSTDIFDLFGEHKELAKDIFLKPFHLVNIQNIPDEDLKQRHLTGLMEFIQKHIFARDVLPYLREIMPQLKQIEHLGETDYIMHIFRYVINAGNVADPDAFIEIISENLSPTIGEKIMTPAQHWEARGEARGEAKGEARGEAKGIKKSRKEIASKLLHTQQMSLETIAELTDLSMDELEALKEEILV
jgi:predicted transposase/invertase (TIGR01784 family)